MATFLSKLRVATLGNVHDLLDKAIDLNSPAAVRQYARDLEDALNRMKSEAAVQAGQVRTQTREVDDTTAKIELGKKTIVQLQQTGHDDLARIKATEVVQLQRQLTEATTALDAQRKASADIDAAVAKLQIKYNDMVINVRNLERLDMDTKSREHAAAALSAAGRLVGSGADISVDDVAGKMRARNDIATEKFNRAMGDVDVTEDPQTTADVDSLLNELNPKAVATASK